MRFFYGARDTVVRDLASTIERQPMRTAFVLVVYFVLFPFGKNYGEPGEVRRNCCGVVQISR